MFLKDYFFYFIPLIRGPNLKKILTQLGCYVTRFSVVLVHTKKVLRKGNEYEYS